MRIKIFVRLLLAGLLFLLTGLVYIQVVRHDIYKTMSEENRLKVLPLTASRGTIYDREGRVLAKDILSFDVSVIYSRIKNKSALADMLSSILGVSKEKIEQGIAKSKKRPYSPVSIVSDIGMEGAIQVEEIESDFPGLMLQVSTKRDYSGSKTAANLLGYIGLINRPEFEKLKHYGYRLNDLVGRDGVEKEYDNYLRGRHGGKQVEADNLGREVSILGYKEPVAGKDVRLTIDIELQEFCYGLLQGKKGAILAMDPNNGAVLAMATAPSYDPEVFVDVKRSGEISRLLNDKNSPLLNRAISGSYPPGSVFKLVVVTGALERDKATPGTTAMCEGKFQLGKTVFRCWKQNGHGIQTMTDAIKNSCNVYFYRLGLLLGVNGIAEYAKKFGFGETTGIDLPGEVKGIRPTREWKKERFGEKWYKGETVNYSIGQGYLQATPVQVGRMISVFANKGRLVTPHVVKEIGGVSVDEFEGVDMDLFPETIDTVRQGLKKCVNDRRGTGMKARLSNIVVAGKTGTAQTSRGKSHGWFAGFAPFEDAKLVVVIFDEYGGKGGYYAAETAGSVFREAERLGLL